MPEIRVLDYLEVSRQRLALLRAALVGIGQQPDPVALAAAAAAVEELQNIVDATLDRARLEAEALEALAKPWRDGGALLPTPDERIH